MTWYGNLDDRARRAFWACFGGWALDAMDVQIYALLLPTIAALWHLTKGQAGALGTVALLASSLGGVIAGNLADRYGRVRVLQISILWFSAFTFLSGLTHGYGELLAARTLQGLGFGGEWAAGAVLIAEVVSPRDRGRVVAAVSSGWSVGYGLAALLFAVFFQFVPAATAWRLMFFAGLAPSLLVLFIRRRVDEPVIYVAAREIKTAPRLREIFARPFAARTAAAWAVCLGVLGGNYTVLTWLAAYLQLERHLSVGGTGLYLLVNVLGSFLGYHIGGVIADRLGRLSALRLFAVVGAASVACYLLLGTSAPAVLLLGFPLGFAQSGMNAGLAPLLSELFPTRLRATGQGFCYNAGRGVGAIFPALVGVASASVGLTAAISVMAGLAYALALVSSFGLTETAGQALARVGEP